MIRCSAKSALLLVAALGLSSCASVPTSGPVQQGEVVEVQSGNTFVRVIARPPTQGLSPTEIVRGFLEAQASRDGNFDVARQYLTPTASQRWDPVAGIEVYEGAGSITPDSSDEITFLAPTYLLIDAQGRPSVPNSTTFTAVDFQLEQSDGQWRISNPPQGLLLSRGDLTRGYRGFALWFPDPAGQVLVPDTVIVPLALEGLATSLTQSLLSGPSGWLAPAVRTAFPPNTTLSLDAVTIMDGVARVPLSTAVLSASDSDRRLLSAQLGKTLAALPGIDSVEILVGSQLLDVPGSSTRVNAADWQAFAPEVSGADALAVFENRPVRVTQAGLQPMFAQAQSELPELSALTQFGEQSLYAGLSKNRRVLTVFAVGGRQLGELAFKRPLSSPRFDRFGVIWVSDSDAVWAVDSKAPELRAIEVFGLPADVAVSGVLPASDGARVLLRAQDATGFFLALAGVARGETLDLTGFHRVDRDLGRTVSASWQDQTSLTLIQEIGLTREIVSFDLTRGQATSVGSFADAVSLASASGRATLVANESGDLYRQVGTDWFLIGSAASPSYPG